MATTVERIAVVETKVDAMIVCIEEIKSDIKDMHDCLDKTRDGLQEKLDEMSVASNERHSALSKELSALKTQRDKLIWTIAGVIGAGGFFAGHADKIFKLFT